MALNFKISSVGEGLLTDFVWAPASGAITPSVVVSGPVAGGSNEYLIVKLVGGANTDNQVTPCTIKTDVVLGVTQNNPLALYAPVSVMLTGLSWVQAGQTGAINPGTQIIGTTSSATAGPGSTPVPGGQGVAVAAYNNTAAAWVVGDSVGGAYNGARGELFATLVHPRLFPS